MKNIAVYILVMGSGILWVYHFEFIVVMLIVAGILVANYGDS